jgi:hypothetical protein
MTNFIIIIRWDSSVSKVTGYGLDERGLILDRGVGLSLRRYIQAASGTHIAHVWYRGKASET